MVIKYFQVANFLKAKLGVSLFSLSVLILIPLLESNFNAPVIIKRWKQLTWNDFIGFAPPFSRYDAAISSQVYLEYDSVTSRFIAYAGQNNIRSWVKEKTKASDYALNHEQYHFNITEVHARLLNGYIEANPNESEAFYKSRLYSIRFDLNLMQDRYDDETDHSVIVHKQRRWEFKIDSMLSLHSADSGWVTDYYSGAKVYFPAPPEFKSELTENLAAHRTFTLSRYNMTLSLTSYQYDVIDASALEKNLRKYYSELSREVERFVIDTSAYRFKVIVVSKDSIKNTILNLWAFNGSYLYRLSASYLRNTTDTLGYHQIANSFISSFRIQNTDNYWMTKFRGSGSMGTHATFTTIPADAIKKVTKNCIKRGGAAQNGFFRGPMFRTDGGVLIAYDIIKHADTLLRETTLIINDDIYAYEPDSTDHLFFVPGDALPKKNYEILFGYQLAQDSTKDCYRLYHQKLAIVPQNFSFRPTYSSNGQ